MYRRKKTNESEWMSMIEKLSDKNVGGGGGK